MNSCASGLYPTDLEVLKRVFDQLCAESSCLPGSPAAEAMAIRLIALFQGGCTREDELLATARPSSHLRQAASA